MVCPRYTVGLQLVRSELLSEDILSLVGSDSRDSGAVNVGYNLICLNMKLGKLCGRCTHVMLNRSHARLTKR